MPSNIEIRGCQIENAGAGSGSGPGVEIQAGSDQAWDIRVHHNEFTGGGVQASVTTLGDMWNVAVLDNQFHAAGIAAVDAAVYMLRAERCQVSGNQFREVDEHGIHLEQCERVNVVGNQFAGVGEATTDTYDAIRLEDDTNRCRVEGNVVDPAQLDSPNLTGQPAVGIHVVDSTCDTNIVVGNDLGATSEYGSAALTDAGTGTILTYPSDATYGDNFTS